MQAGIRYRFLLHFVRENHHKSVLAVNVTALSSNVADVKVNGTSLPYIQYGSWPKAAAHFLEIGANQEAIDTAERHLGAMGAAVLTIF